MKITKGSGNVFKDLGFKNPNVEMLKSSLKLELFKILKKAKLTQVQAAKKLGIGQPELSRLKTGNYAHYSLDRLITFVEKFDRKVDIKITKVKK